MNTPVAVLRTSEISLKGKNRRLFERQLAFNVKKTLKNNNLDFISTQRLNGRLLVYFRDFTALAEARKVFGFVFGVETYSTGVLTAKSLEKIKKAVEEFTDKEFDNFRVSAKRQDKKFSMSSPQIEKELGAHIQTKTGKEVDLKNFDKEFFIEVCEAGVVVSAKNYPGAGGLPVGAGGRVGVLSDYENPEFAAYYMLKRGCEVVFFGEVELSYLSRFNNFENPQILEAKSKEDNLGTMEEEKILVLVAGSRLEDVPQLKKEFPETLVLAPLVGFSEEEIQAKNI